MAQKVWLLWLIPIGWLFYRFSVKGKYFQQRKILHECVTNPVRNFGQRELESLPEIWA